MGVRVAYGKKGRISAAIASGTIPKDSLIITSDSKESDILFQCITVLIGFRISFLLTGNCLPLIQATLALAMSK